MAKNCDFEISGGSRRKSLKRADVRERSDKEHASGDVVQNVNCNHGTLQSERQNVHNWPRKCLQQWWRSSNSSPMVLNRERERSVLHLSTGIGCRWASAYIRAVRLAIP